MESAIVKNWLPVSKIAIGVSFDTSTPNKVAIDATPEFKLKVMAMI